jgi:LysM repeat protein
MVICPECGARQRMQASTVRCASCHGRAQGELTVCPHCGRNLRPAGPRWTLWLAAVAAVALLGLWGLGRVPVNKVRDTVISARTNAKGLVQILDAVAVSPDLPQPEAEAPQIVADLPATATPTPTVTPTPTELIVTDVFTETAPALDASAPIVTVTLTVEAGTTPEEDALYTVQAGDSFLGIGARLGIPWEQIAALNSLNGNSVLKIGQKLRLPGPTATPTVTLQPTATGTAAATETPTATATAVASPTPTRRSNQSAAALTATPTALPRATVTPPPTAIAKGSVATYRIRSGDTLSKVGAQFGIPWQDIAAANRINASTRLNVGQSLVIPLAGPLAQSPTPASRPSPTPTPGSQPQTPQLLAPVLRDPGNQTPFQGENTFIVLSWQPVIGIPPGAHYRVTIRWVQDGVPQEALTDPTTSTEQRFPPWLFSRADQFDGRKYTWSVQVVQPTTDGKGGTVYLPLSAPSAIRTLTWN